MFSMQYQLQVNDSPRKVYWAFKNASIGGFKIHMVNTYGIYNQPRPLLDPKTKTTGKSAWRTIKKKHSKFES